MRLLDPHPNIIGLYDVSVHEAKTELYLVMELMDCDLHKVIQSKQKLTDKHFQCFTKQLLEGTCRDELLSNYGSGTHGQSAV